MKNTNIAAIILSGGYSSRMGSFKPLLKFGEKSAIELLVDTYKSAGISNIIIVTGYKGSEVAEKLRDSGITCIQNENYAQGMFTSVIKGIKALDTDIAAFFIHPVDIPLVKKHTIEVLKNKYLQSDQGIIYPEFCARKGHPPLIDCKYQKAILSSDGEGGLKKILEKYSSDSVTVAVYDRAILMDMDTQADYERLLVYFHADAPDKEEYYRIIDLYGVPEKIIRHCRKVAEVSVEILRSLDNAGYALNESALQAAAMLHDMARMEKNHAEAAAEILKDIGYGKVASIVGSHMDIEVNDDGKVTESEILYLADKLVKEDKLISLEERFQPSFKKYHHNPEVLSKIENRRDAAYKIIKKIEALTGKGFIYG